MIQKLNSSELNTIFRNSYNKLEDGLTDFNNIEADINKKTKIMSYELEYIGYLTDRLTTEFDHYQPCFLVDSINNNFEAYGSTVHPKFIGTPMNIFNLKTASSDEYYFRNDAIVSVNGHYKDEYTDILKHDTLAKAIFFEEFDSDTVTIKISLPEQSKVLGPTTFNTIEFDSFLNGSYDITSIKVENSQDETYPIELCGGTDYIHNAGKLRIALSQRYNFQTITFTCKLNYHTNNANSVVYPFGLKHIYFYNANYQQFNVDSDGEKEILSYAIYKVNLPTGSELNSINQSVVINTPSESREAICSNEGIEFYAYYEDNVLSGLLPTSKLDENPYPGNFNSFYIKVPLIDIGLEDDVSNKTITSVGIDYTVR